MGSFCLEVSAQACGYSYAKFFVTDAAGSIIRNAGFEFLEKNSSDLAIHSRKPIRWSEEEGNYFLSEGLCGGHRNVRVKISATGFEAIEQIIDLPLTNAKYPKLYRIGLKKIDSKQIPSFEYLSHLKGTIFDAYGAVVPNAKVSAKSTSGRVFSTVTSEIGEYTLELPYNSYDDSSSGFREEAKYIITVEKEGFIRPLIEYIFIPSQFGAMSLDIGLSVSRSSDSVK